MASRFTSKTTTVTLFDATSGTRLEIEAGPGQGDFTCSNLFAEGNAEKIEARNRGVHDGLVEGDDLVQEFSITLEQQNEELTHATNERVMDFIRKAGAFAAAVSFDADEWAFGVEIVMTKGAATTTITLPKCTAIASLTEGKETNTLSISGTNYTAPTVA